MPWHGRAPDSGPQTTPMSFSKHNRPARFPGTTTSSQPQVRPKTSARPDVDTEEDEDRTCRSMAVGQRGGNSCHDAFATLVSGQPRDEGVETPEGLYADFDGLGRGRLLFEVKTGYRFLLDKSASTEPLRRQTIARFVEQASRQSLVAARCGYSLEWWFNNRDVANEVQGYVEPPVEARPYDCKEDR